MGDLLLLYNGSHSSTWMVDKLCIHIFAKKIGIDPRLLPSFWEAAESRQSLKQAEITPFGIPWASEKVPFHGQPGGRLTVGAGISGGFSCGTDFWYVYTGGPSPWDDRILLGNCDVVIESHRVEVVWCFFCCLHNKMLIIQHVDLWISFSDHIIPKCSYGQLPIDGSHFV